MADRVLVPDSVAPADQTAQRILVPDGQQDNPHPILEMAGKAAAWLSHLGQPEWAKKLVDNIANDPSLKSVSGYDPMAAMGGGLVNNSAIAPKTGVGPQASAAVDMATSPMSYIDEGVGLLSKIPAVSKAAQVVSKGGENLAAKGASTMTQLPVDLIKKASTKEGAQAIVDAGKNQTQIAGKLVQLANDPSRVAGKGSEIEDAVRTPEAAAAKVDIRPILKAFDNAKFTPTDFNGDALLSKKANAALESEKSAMEGSLANPPKAGKPTTSPIVDQYGGPIITPGKPAPEPPSPLVNPTKFREMKTQIGKGIPWDAPEAKTFQTRMQGIYAAMDKALTDAVKSTQGPEVAAQYQKDLSEWSQKINDFKELDSRLGKNPSVRLDRALAIIRGANEDDKPGLTNLLQNIDSHAGTNLAQESQDVQFANMLTKFGKGKTPLNPNQVGKPALIAKGSIVPAIPSSPLIGVLATKAARNVPSLGKNAAQLSPLLSGVGSLGR